MYLHWVSNESVISVWIYFFLPVFLAAVLGLGFAVFTFLALLALAGLATFAFLTTFLALTGDFFFSAAFFTFFTATFLVFLGDFATFLGLGLSWVWQRLWLASWLSRVLVWVSLASWRPRLWPVWRSPRLRCPWCGAEARWPPGASGRVWSGSRRCLPPCSGSSRTSGWTDATRRRGSGRLRWPLWSSRSIWDATSLSWSFSSSWPWMRE